MARLLEGRTFPRGTLPATARPVCWAWKAVVFPAFLAIAALPACLREEHAYPATWPPPTTGAGRECPRIAGTYANEGEATAGEGTTRRVYLSQMLRFSKDADALPDKMRTNEEDVAQVRFDQRDEARLQVQFLAKDGRLIREFTYSRESGDYTCIEEGLKRTAPVRFDAYLYPGPISGFTKGALVLTTNSAGNVLMTATAEGVAFLFFVIPVGGQFRLYATFSKVEGP